MVEFLLPSALTPYSRGSDVVTIDEPCATVRDALEALNARLPAVVDRILDEQGVQREHVNIFVGDESVRYLDGLDTSLGARETIMIIPAVSGG